MQGVIRPDSIYAYSLNLYIFICVYISVYRDITNLHFETMFSNRHHYGQFKATFFLMIFHALLHVIYNISSIYNKIKYFILFQTCFTMSFVYILTKRKTKTVAL